jgi:hypothetical protein
MQHLISNYREEDVENEAAALVVTMCPEYTLFQLARPTRLIQIAFGRSSPLRGALRASKTLARFVELVTPAFGGSGSDYRRFGL